MKDKYLIVRKESFFSKIKNWFNNIFAKNIISDEKKHTIDKKESSADNISNITESIGSITEKKDSNTENIDSNFKKKYQEDKSKFMDIYNKVKNKEIDVDELDDETADKICKLLNEEILMKMNRINDKYQRINNKKNNEP